MTKAGPTDPLSLTLEPSAIASTAAGEQKPMSLLGKTIDPGMINVLYWSPGVSFDGNSIPRGVLVANGTRPGPTLCLTAVLHGDEHNGLEIVRRVLYEIDPTHLSGAVVGVPIVNLDGFRRGTRYLPDRRDLNRYFPGKEQAAQPHASRIRCSKTSSGPATISSTSTPARSTAPTSRRCAAI